MLSHEELLAALKKYGVHKNGCAAFPAVSEEQVVRDCDCGFSDIVLGLI